jgi:hypothetical protein
MQAWLSALIQRYTEKKPAKKKLIGKWHSSDGAELDILNDGTFVGKSLPAERFFFAGFKSEADEQKMNGKGMWRLEKKQAGFWEVKLEFTEMNNKPLMGHYSVFMSGEWNF